MKNKAPFVPQERHDTVRHEIMALLREETLNAKGVSAAVGIPEKEVYDHLEQIRSNRREHRLVVDPATCLSCGFVFGKRERLAKPGKCPVCRGQHISLPSFTLVDRS